MACLELGQPYALRCRVDLVFPAERQPILFLPVHAGRAVATAGNVRSDGQGCADDWRSMEGVRPVAGGFASPHPAGIFWTGRGFPCLHPSGFPPVVAEGAGRLLSACGEPGYQYYARNVRPGPGIRVREGPSTRYAALSLAHTFPAHAVCI